MSNLPLSSMKSLIVSGQCFTMVVRSNDLQDAVVYGAIDERGIEVARAAVANVTQQDIKLLDVGIMRTRAASALCSVLRRKLRQ